MLNSLRGSNILAEIFNNDRYLVGSKLACCERSTKSNINRSVSVFQIEPNTLTIAFSEVLPAAIGGPFIVFAYDSCSLVMVFVLPRSVIGFAWSFIPLIASCTIFEFVFHFLKLNPPLCVSDFDFEHSSNAFASSPSPVKRLSTYRDFFRSSMKCGLNSSDTCESKWCLIVDAKIAGDRLSPNTRWVNLKCTISEFRSSGSLSHKNHSISLSLSLIPTMRKAFSMSAVRPILCQRKFTSVSNNCGV